MVVSGMSECNHHLQVMDFALTSNNSQLLNDVAKCLDTVSRIQQARAAKTYHDAIIYNYICNLCMQIYL